MKYFIVMIAVAFLALFGVVLLVGSIGGGSGDTNRVTKLADFDDNAATRVSLTIQGKVAGEDQRRAIRISVTQDQRIIEVLSGYDERVEKRAEFANTDSGFATFLRALDGLNFGRERRVAQADDRAVCPLGNRYIYRLAEGSHEIMRTWSTSCRRDEGSFNGTRPEQIQQLFKLQITDYNRFVQGIQL